VSFPESWIALIRLRRAESCAVKQAFSPELDERIAAAAFLTAHALRAGGRVFAFGNGGSASDAQHFVAELVGRYREERAALPAMAFTANSSTMTAVSNDYGYEHVFARQVEAWVRAGDVVFAMSTSGTSANVVRGAAAARARGAAVVALTGESGGPLAEVAEVAIRVPSQETPRIQEAHILVLHTIAELVESP
jgi:phosphoheptose isomerase